MIHPFSEIVTPFPGVLLDAYGVFWNGKELLPGAKVAMESLVKSDKIVGILSNSSQLVEKEAQKFEKLGLYQGIHYNFILTSGSFAQACFRQGTLPFPTPRQRYWVFGSPHPRFSDSRILFESSCYQETTDIQAADFIYIDIPHIEGEDQTEVTPFIPALQAILPYGLPMVCANPDKIAHAGKRCVIRQGSIALAYTQMGGQVFSMGKPERVVFEAALASFSGFGISNPSDILMVGDTPETDIEGANKVGLATALVIHTGLLDRRFPQGFDASLLAPLARPQFLIPRLEVESISDS